MVLALSAIQRGDLRRNRIWLLATAALGATFIGGQVYEFTSFIRQGLTLKTNLFGSSFFVMTGFHGVHVTVGIIMLLSLVSLSQRGKLPQEKAEVVEIVGLYWHFVDIVWIVIFTVVYLVPAPHNEASELRMSPTQEHTPERRPHAEGGAHGSHPERRHLHQGRR